MMNPIPAFLQRLLKPTLLSLLLLAGILPHLASAQSPEEQLRAKRVSNILSNSAMMQRIYLHFFEYQRYLDSVADQQEAAGKNAGGMRHVFQKQLGFSDEEYKPIRNSCDRFSEELKSLRDEIKSHPNERSGFADERNRRVSLQIATIGESMSSKNKAAFEALLVRMFAPQQMLQEGEGQ